ncbi:MAG: hypothetical protein ABSH56_25030 [Bryobacteraceae bacterium]|jgi:hypothetical protein
MRICLVLLALAGLALADALPKSETLRGTLQVHASGPATVTTDDHRTIALDGDEPTNKVLADPRLNGYSIEARGHFTSTGRFLLDPSHLRSLMVRQDGKLKLITYFCGVCNIRAYIPGPCACCQRETVLELRDPDEK